MDRRGFLQSCLALSTAPMIVRAESLMALARPETIVWSGGIQLQPWQQEFLKFLEEAPGRMAVAPTRLYVPAYLAKEAERILGVPVIQSTTRIMDKDVVALSTCRSMMEEAREKGIRERYAKARSIHDKPPKLP